MKKTIKTCILIMVVPALALIHQSCFEDLNDFTYDGPTLAEFSHLSYNEGEADWESVGSYWTATITGATDNAPLQVSMVGPQKNEAVEVGYYIAEQVYRDTEANKLRIEQPDHENWVSLETTAVEGTDYNILDNGIITIPANSSFGPLNMELTPSDSRSLFIVLEERDIKPSENYKIFRLNIEP
jgi:hypothetical protein